MSKLSREQQFGLCVKWQMMRKKNKFQMNLKNKKEKNDFTCFLPPERSWNWFHQGSWTPLNWLTLGLGKPGMFSMCVFTQLLSKVALLANLLSDKDKKVNKVPFPTQPLHSDFL